MIVVLFWEALGCVRGSPGAPLGRLWAPVWCLFGMVSRGC